jgi:hypothetical protein
MGGTDKKHGYNVTTMDNPSIHKSNSSNFDDSNKSMLLLSSTDNIGHAGYTIDMKAIK